MAFKMKGSPIKLGNIATKSVLKHSGKEYAAENVEIHKGRRYEVNEKTQRAHDKAHSDGTVDENHNPVKKERAKEMETPLEQKKIIKGIKKVGKKIKELGDKYDTGEKVGEAVKKAVSKKVKEYKPTRETTVKEKQDIRSYKDRKGRDRYSGTTTVTATDTKKRKKLFGGGKTKTKSASRTYEVDQRGNRQGFGDYGEVPVEGGMEGVRKRRAGTETTVHTRKKKRGGGVKKTVDIDASGKKTVTKYDKEGKVKKTKVRDTKAGNIRRQERLMREGTATRKALKKEAKEN